MQARRRVLYEVRWLMKRTHIVTIILCSLLFASLAGNVYLFRQTDIGLYSRLSTSCDGAELDQIVLTEQSTRLRESNFDWRTKNATVLMVLSGRDKQCNEVLKAIERLLTFDIDVDAYDDAGRTALHYAAMVDNERAFSLLLQVGARLSHADRSGLTVMDVIVSRDSVKIAEYLTSQHAAGHSSEYSHAITDALARWGHSESRTYIKLKAAFSSVK
jgi:ankyrin repeat protein